MTITPRQLRLAEKLAREGASLILQPDPADFEGGITADHPAELRAARERYRRGYEAIFGKPETPPPVAGDLVLREYDPYGGVNFANWANESWSHPSPTFRNETHRYEDGPELRAKTREFEEIWRKNQGKPLPSAEEVRAAESEMVLQPPLPESERGERVFIEFTGQIDPSSPYAPMQTALVAESADGTKLIVAGRPKQGQTVAEWRRKLLAKLAAADAKKRKPKKKRKPRR